MTVMYDQIKQFRHLAIADQIHNVCDVWHGIGNEAWFTQLTSR